MNIWIALVWITLGGHATLSLAEKPSPYDQYYQKWITLPKKDKAAENQLFYETVQKEKAQENAKAIQEQKLQSQKLAEEAKRAEALERAKNPNLKETDEDEETDSPLASNKTNPSGKPPSAPTRNANSKPLTPATSTAPGGKVESGTAQEAIIFTGE